MLGDQLESTELLGNIFNTFLAGLTADFVPLPQVIPGSFFPVPEHLLVDTRMVYKALRGIKSNKSGGPDPIPAKVWKEFAFELSPVITNIYNASMVQGYVPVFLKQSEVVTVPKCSPPKVVEKIFGLFLSRPILRRSWKGLRWIPSSSKSVASLTPSGLPWPGSPQPTLLFTSSKSSLRPLTKVTLMHASSLLISVKVLI